GAMAILDGTLYVAQVNGGAVSTIDTATLVDHGPLLDGLVTPHSVVTSGGMVYVAGGRCGTAVSIVRIDPQTLATHTLPLPTGHRYCTQLVASPTEPGVLFTGTVGLSPVTLGKWEVSGP